MNRVALHPEAVDGDPRTVRWVVPAGVLPFIGVVRTAPRPLGALLDDGVLDSIVTEALAVRTRLAAGQDWSRWGVPVRDAVADAVGAPMGWLPEQAAALDADVRLADCVREVMAGDVGDYVRSHGGVIDLIAAHDDVAEVALSGVCASCPAGGQTIQGRVETAVRRRYPQLREVRRVESADTGDAVEAGARRPLPLRALRQRRRSG